MYKFTIYNYDASFERSINSCVQHVKTLSHGLRCSGLLFVLSVSVGECSIQRKGKIYLHVIIMYTDLLCVLGTCPWVHKFKLNTTAPGQGGMLQWVYLCKTVLYQKPTHGFMTHNTITLHNTIHFLPKHFSWDLNTSCPTMPPFLPSQHLLQVKRVIPQENVMMMMTIHVQLLAC